MNEINKQDELQHWGILGMRWGVRRSKKQLDKEANKKKAENESESFKTSKKKSVSKLTDDEIRNEINRRKLETDLQKQKDDELATQIRHLELEKQYTELNPPKLSMGQKMFNDIWPVVKKSTLDAGGQLLKDGLIKKGKQLLGLEDTKETNYDTLIKKMQYEEMVNLKEKTGFTNPENAKKYGNEIEKLNKKIEEQRTQLEAQGGKIKRYKTAFAARNVEESMNNAPPLALPYIPEKKKKKK